MRATTGLSLALALALAGCQTLPLFYPHFVRTQPEVDGVLVSAGVPRAGVQIKACEGLSESGEQLTPSRCDRVAIVTTDAQGRFHLESHGYVDSDLIPTGDRSTFEILGVEAGGRELVWHQVWRRPSPPRLVMACELGERLVCQSSQVP
jgi:hypothetical protein